jgi:histidinol-phosphatase (PHP family)
VDFFIGSVHHVHGIPIDYDTTMYNRARELAGGSDLRLFEDYFDAQLEMLETLKPKVVGHFDLIRLLSDEPNRDLRVWEGVWVRAVRNLKVVVEQGGLLEINSAALRKGLKEPYPGRAICEVFLGLGGKLTLSDDSHGIDHIATNFEKAVGFLESLGVKEVWLLEAASGNGRTALSTKSVAVDEVKKSLKV